MHIIVSHFYSKHGLLAVLIMVYLQTGLSKNKKNYVNRVLTPVQLYNSEVRRDVLQLHWHVNMI